MCMLIILLIGKLKKMKKRHSKNKTPVFGNAILILGVKIKRGYYVFW